MHGVRCWIVVIVSMLATSAAQAQAQVPAPEPLLGEGGHVAVSVDRLFGYVHSRVTTEPPGGMAETATYNRISILGSPFSGLSSLYSFPRVAVDGFLGPGVSLGAAVGYFRTSQSSSNANALGVEQTISGFAFAPRVGFAARLGSPLAVWPRAGITYLYFSSESSIQGVSASTSSVYLLAATVEVPLVITLAPRAMVLLGPTVDIGLAGSAKLQQSNSPDPATNSGAKETDIGFQASFLLLL